MQKVVSTKLTEDQHTKLLDTCNSQGCTPSSFIKQSIMEKIEANSEEISADELRKILWR